MRKSTPLDGTSSLEVVPKGVEIPGGRGTMAGPARRTPGISGV